MTNRKGNAVVRLVFAAAVLMPHLPGQTSLTWAQVKDEVRVHDGDPATIVASLAAEQQADLLSSAAAPNPVSSAASSPPPTPSSVCRPAPS